MTTTPETIRICNFCGERYDSTAPSAVALRELFCRAGCAAAYRHVADGADPEPIVPDLPRRRRPAPRRRPRRRFSGCAPESSPVPESAAGACRCRPDGGGSPPVGEEPLTRSQLQFRYHREAGGWLLTPYPVAAYLDNPKTSYRVVVGGTETEVASLGLALERAAAYWNAHGVPSRIDGVLNGQRRTLIVVPEFLTRD